MATELPSQRVYRAACPNCGAPVEFRSAASPFAVCSFCKSTVVREGDALRKIGESADVFDDHSPLQIGAGGVYQGSRFSLVGRLQYQYAQGTWNEWHVLFDSGKSGWLSEDNGRYVIAFEAALTGPVPAAAALRAGSVLTLDGRPWSVASVSVAKLIAAQGELPKAPVSGRGFVVCDLRNTFGEVGTLDYGDPAAPGWSIGRSVAISELAMSGLADAAEKTLAGRTIECPNCGASLEVQLSSTRSIVCRQCRSVIDVSQGVGGDLQHYAQQYGLEPLIPLGSVGTLAFGGPALPWQVVGYVERCEVPDNSEDEQSFWREYLLYHRTEGFAFIVDAQDGWSWTVPITGVPESAGSGAKYAGTVYRKLYDYTGMVTYVLGEFYWQVSQNQRTFNTDFQGTGSAASKRLNREQSGSGSVQEVVWSAGETLAADAIMTAFRLAPAQTAAMRRDVAPTALTTTSLRAKMLFWIVLMVVLFLLIRCSEDDDGGGGGGGYGTVGGAYGGYSSGGSHK